MKQTLIMGHNFEQAVDTDDIAEKLDYFCRKPAELRELAERCHAFVQQFGWANA